MINSNLNTVKNDICQIKVWRVNPTSAQAFGLGIYGDVLRIGGTRNPSTNSWNGTDSYFIAVSSTGLFYAGYSTNQMTSISWKKL